MCEVPRFLGGPVRQPYILPEEKNHKFLVLREAILASSEVTVKTLQRFAG